MKKTVCVDMDGVLADYSKGWQGIDHIGDPIPGAVEFTRRLSEFADVLIWTTRCNPEIGGRSGEGANLLASRVRAWLDHHGFTYADVWTGPVKPIAAAFVDDRAIRCRPQDHGPCAFDGAIKQATALCGESSPGCSFNHKVTELEKS